MTAADRKNLHAWLDAMHGSIRERHEEFVAACYAASDDVSLRRATLCLGRAILELDKAGAYLDEVEVDR